MDDGRTEETGGSWVTLAVLGRTHGLRGAIYAGSEHGVERFEALREARLRRPDGRLVRDGEAFEIESVHARGGRLLFRFAGIDSVEEAGELTGCEVVIPETERAPLAEGEFYLSDLLGCKVYDRRSEQEVGVVASWQEFGGPPTLEVSRGDEIVWIPCVRAICVVIDPGSKRIEIEAPEGLLELNAGSRG